MCSGQDRAERAQGLFRGTMCTKIALPRGASPLLTLCCLHPNPTADPRAGAWGRARRGLHGCSSSRRSEPVLFNRSSHWQSISSPNRLISSTDIPLSHRANHRPQPCSVLASPSCHHPPVQSLCALFPALWLSCSPRQSRDVLTVLPCTISP